MCLMFILLYFDRECGQQHHSCCDLPEDHRDFDGELHRPTQAVGLQATEQLAVPDSLLVRFPQTKITFLHNCSSDLTFRITSSSSSRSGDRVPLHCVDRHPNQQHIVATGGQDGMLCVWDIRQGSAPFSLMEAHSAESKSLVGGVGGKGKVLQFLF